MAAPPTPIGVAVGASGKAKAFEDRLTASLLSALESDQRFTPRTFPEEPAELSDEAAALATLEAGRDAFMLLEAEEAKDKLREGTRQLLINFFQKTVACSTTSCTRLHTAEQTK